MGTLLAPSMYYIPTWSLWESRVLTQEVAALDNKLLISGCFAPLDPNLSSWFIPIAVLGSGLILLLKAHTYQCFRECTERYLAGILLRYIIPCYSLLTTSKYSILLMTEILHHLKSPRSVKLLYFQEPRWCKNSYINNTARV